MLLNPKHSSFYFNFPKGFFSPRVVDKYLPYIKKQPIPFDNIQDYVNSTIQSISFPGINMDTVEQVRVLGKKIGYKSSTPVQDLFSKEFSMNFKHVDGFINYFIMLDTILDFLDFENPELFVEDLSLRILDSEGNVVESLKFKETMYTSLSNIDFNYSNNNPQFSTFSLGFKCNYIHIDINAK